MKPKFFYLTALLAVGFAFPNCGIHCDCDPIEGRFFDIKGMNIEHYTTKPKNGSADIDDGTTIPFADYAGLGVEFDVDYVVTQQKCQPSWGFSLMNHALACECLYNGMSGSKDERLDSLNVITLNDFDDSHPANSSINDLLTIYDFTTVVPLDSFVANSVQNIDIELWKFLLAKAPETNKEFKVKVVVGLSTGEVYEKESKRVVLED